MRDEECARSGNASSGNRLGPAAPVRAAPLIIAEALNTAPNGGLARVSQEQDQSRKVMLETLSPCGGSPNRSR